MTNVRSDSGFTLLEVLVATTILAMALGALFPIFGAAPQRLADARDAAIALQIAERHLDEQLALEAWSSLPLIGDDDTWGWSVEAKPLDDLNIEGLSDYPLHVSAAAWLMEKPDIVSASLERVVWVQNQ